MVIIGYYVFMLLESPAVIAHLETIKMKRLSPWSPSGLPLQLLYHQMWPYQLPVRNRKGTKAHSRPSL